MNITTDIYSLKNDKEQNKELIKQIVALAESIMKGKAPELDKFRLKIGITRINPYR